MTLTEPAPLLAFVVWSENLSAIPPSQAARCRISGLRLWPHCETTSITSVVMRVCDVMVSFCQYLIHRKRDRTNAAVDSLKEAIGFARAGMEAWPADKTREDFSTSYFLNAQRWLENT